MNTKLYVGNLPFTATDQDLNDMFSQVGQVASAKVIMDRESGRSKGFGFVEMNNEAEGEKAIGELNNEEFLGKAISVSKARPKPATSGAGGGGGGDRRSNFNRRY